MLFRQTASPDIDRVSIRMLNTFSIPSGKDSIVFWPFTIVMVVHDRPEFFKGNSHVL